MDVNKYIYSVRITKQVYIVGFGLGKRQAADKTLRGRAGIANGSRANDAPHEVTIAIRINAFARRAGIVAPVHSPHFVAPGFHYMVATIGIGARQHPDVERLHHHLDIEGGPFSATVCQAGLVRIRLNEINRELDDRIRVHQFPSMHTANDQDPAAICTAASAQAQSKDGPAFNRIVQGDARAELRFCVNEGIYSCVELRDRAIHANLTI
jgi:hypothetical protein